MNFIAVIRRHGKGATTEHGYVATPEPPLPRSLRLPRNKVAAVAVGIMNIGDDCWLALAVESDEQWQWLCAALERPELAERFPTVEARRAARDEIDRAIETWSTSLDHNEATRRLQAAGVPAGPVLANWELVSDPHLHERGYWVDTVHPEVGFQRYEGLPWKLSRTPPPTRARPAPLFGEHNAEVVLGDLGLDASRLASLRESRAILDEPRGLRAMRPIAD